MKNYLKKIAVVLALVTVLGSTTSTVNAACNHNSYVLYSSDVVYQGRDVHLWSGGYCDVYIVGYENVYICQVCGDISGHYYTVTYHTACGAH